MTIYERDFIGPIGPRDSRMPSRPGAFVARTGSYTRFAHVWNGSLRLMTYVCFANVSELVRASYLPIDGSRSVEDLMAAAEREYLGGIETDRDRDPWWRDRYGHDTD